MTEEEFRSDENAVAALEKFLSSKEGVKFLSLLEDESPLSKLASKENQQPGNVRDIALAEQGSSDSLLGRCIGWDLVRKMISRCRTKMAKSSEREPRHARVAKVMSEKSE